MKHPICSHCGAEDVRMRKQITSSGSIQYAWRCAACNRWAENPMKWIPHDLLKKALERQGKKIEDVPVIEDYSTLTPCVICSNPGEFHHWAPQAYESDFGVEWTAWPTAALCLEHHRQWHSIVTPTLVNHKTKDQK